MAFVLESLREGILSGAIAEGTPLRQDELASKFGLSRMPIRDAIRQLEAEGLVIYEPHKGASVAIMTIDDIVEIYDMRIMAECTALDFGFDNIADSDLIQMRGILSAMEDTEDPHLLSELNESFHRHLYSKANRPRLLALIKSLHDSVDRHLRFLLTNLDYHKKSQQDHKNILHACTQGNREAAKEFLANHLADGRDSIVSFLNSRR
ncbi:GntR family transcriptional regulator [Pseudomonas guariconensis]|uniref:GntR family transcriptional regulator n=1 Tax=Pseudomonas TaxID=286 RepID=UPI0020980001|nr:MULTISPECIES: GntR family transcriptional regulator [Pseudomonas]MCO7516186.1 GntR family transcriptional regulator [Pseudomonas putida]MCO7567706.1 GntR family transcriptional regulator [Pseudomonas mosselii]MCO7597502.1 GntR family transcriptional regulator [Pseudomonas guariconensis]MCO7606020.1 GntR family transcriptional regulator [Pseudomonas guariconensis]MCO7619097.1 GntR family transcriptional regulator [Pseudomonas guariconensis]